MPPAKSKFATEDTRSEASTIRERQIAAAAHARKSKNGASAQNNGSSLKDLALASADASNASTQSQGVSARPSQELSVHIVDVKHRWHGSPRQYLFSIPTESHTICPHPLHSPHLSTKPCLRTLGSDGRVQRWRGRKRRDELARSSLPWRYGRISTRRL
jgi:hypothetical protein